MSDLNSEICGLIDGPGIYEFLDIPEIIWIRVDTLNAPTCRCLFDIGAIVWAATDENEPFIVKNFVVI